MQKRIHWRRRGAATNFRLGVSLCDEGPAAAGPLSPQQRRNSGRGRSSASGQPRQSDDLIIAAPSPQRAEIAAGQHELAI
jgi:hypothetical protein